MRAFLSTLVFVLLLSGCEPSEDPEITRAKKVVADSVRDPESIRFYSIEKCERPGIIFGEFDAKNGFGAYPGKQTFFVVGGIPYLYEDFAPDPDYQSRYRFFTQLMDRCFGKEGEGFNDYFEYDKAYSAGKVGCEPLMNGLLPASPNC